MTLVWMCKNPFCGQRFIAKVEREKNVGDGNKKKRIP